MMPAKKLYTEEQLRAHKNARTAQRYRENKEKIAIYHAEWHQRKKATDPTYMQRQREKTAAYFKAHPEKLKANNAKRRREKPQETKQRSREWFANNRDKACVYQQNRRKKVMATGGKISPNIKNNLMVLQQGRCVCCRCDLTKAVVNLDHIMPLALGGEHTDKNMQLLCKTCNNQKYCKHPVDFMQEKGYLL
jgi:5-methylcytosine-specific restriction endonuclease McrA